MSEKSISEKAASKTAMSEKTAAKGTKAKKTVSKAAVSEKTVPSLPEHIPPADAAAAPLTTPLLLEYLQDYEMPEIPVAEDVLMLRPSNTTSKAFGFHDIPTPVKEWGEFNFTNLLQRHSAILNSVLPNGVQNAVISPRRDAPVRSENQINTVFVRSVYVQLNRALRATQMPEGHTRITDQEGNAIKDGSSADRIGITDDWKQVRLVGDIKPSWKWQSKWRNGKENEEQYRQVLSQVHYYMNKKGTRYGYVLTDHEFVAVIRTGDAYGDVRVSGAVRWKTVGCGGMSLVMALWYLYMLAAEDSRWCLEGIPRPELEPASINDSQDASGNDDDDDDEWKEGQ
jgi:hypothetical protein